MAPQPSRRLLRRYRAWAKRGPRFPERDDKLSPVSVKGQYVGLARGYKGAKILVNERKQLLELGLGTKPAVHLHS